MPKSDSKLANICRQVSAFNPHEDEETASCVRRSQRLKGSVPQESPMIALLSIQSDSANNEMRWHDLTWHELLRHDTSMKWSDIRYDMIWFHMLWWFQLSSHLIFGCFSLGRRTSQTISWCCWICNKSAGCPAGAYQQVTGLLSFLHVF